MLNEQQPQTVVMPVMVLPKESPEIERQTSPFGSLSDRSYQRSQQQQNESDEEIGTGLHRGKTFKDCRKNHRDYLGVLKSREKSIASEQLKRLIAYHERKNAEEDTLNRQRSFLRQQQQLMDATRDILNQQPATTSTTAQTTATGGTSSGLQNNIFSREQLFRGRQ